MSCSSLSQYAPVRGENVIDCVFETHSTWVQYILEACKCPQDFECAFSSFLSKECVGFLWKELQWIAGQVDLLQLKWISQYLCYPTSFMAEIWPTSIRLVPKVQKVL